MPYFYLTVLVIIIDQMAKLMVQTKMFPMQSIHLMNGWFSLTYAINYGAAFGILQSQTLLLVGITIAVVIMVWLKRRQMSSYPKVMQIGLAVALGGAIGNLIDRVRLGFVVDFFNFFIWPIFNIADMAIVIGVCCIIIGMFGKDLRQKLSRGRKMDQVGQTLERPVIGEEKP
jgi:signal peptidase II